MRHRRAGVVSVPTVMAAVLALALTGCASTEAPETVGVATIPTGGVPTQVFWPSDWLEGLSGEVDGVGGTIVGISLAHQDGQWVWRIQSTDPDRDTGDETRGLDAEIDAVDSETVSSRHIRLDDEQLVEHRVSALEAADLSGEAYPSPRLVSLWLTTRNGEPIWTVTLYDNVSAETTDLTIDANSGEILPAAP